MKLWLDLETYSETSIRDGTHRYAQDAEVLLFAYAVDDDEPKVWDVTANDTPPEDLQEAMALADEVWAQNSQFDRTVLEHNRPDLCPPLPMWRDTMIQAMAHSLPGALGNMCDAMGVSDTDSKDIDGKRLIRLFCMPRTFTHSLKLREGETRKELQARIDALKAQWVGRATRESHPEDWAKFIDYASRDIRAMRAAHKRIPMWNYSGDELRLWHLDQTINRRGIQVDVDLAKSALAAVDKAQKALRGEVSDLTLGSVDSATRRDVVLRYLAEEHGILLDDLKGSTVERQLDNEDIPQAVRDLLRIRQQASTSSTSKYKALLKSVSRDGRLRGLLQFNGAARTGRFAGRIFQPQNLPRPTLKQTAIDEGIEALKGGYADLYTDDVMQLCSSALRGCLVAREGHKLAIADLSNIEGRGLAWLAREQWKLDAFADYDTVKGADGEWISGLDMTARTLAGETIDLELDRKGEPVRKGHDLYKLAYAKSFAIDAADVDKEQRQVGKVQELALGYQGGVGAFVTFALAYGIDLDDLARKVIDAADQSLVSESRSLRGYLAKKNVKMHGLAPETWVGCDVAKRGWREGHPAVASWWGALEENFKQAIDNPGVGFEVRSVVIKRPMGKGGKPLNWVTITLPSGRRLCYPSAHIQAETGKIRFMGMNQYTRKWTWLTTYGGKLAENITQAFARDVLVYPMPDIDAQGYPIVLSVHDELLTEPLDSDEFSSDYLAAMMSNVPPWATGLPLAAAGFEAYRYRKD